MNVIITYLIIGVAVLCIWLLCGYAYTIMLEIESGKKQGWVYGRPIDWLACIVMWPYLLWCIMSVCMEAVEVLNQKGES